MVEREHLLVVALDDRVVGTVVVREQVVVFVRVIVEVEEAVGSAPRGRPCRDARVQRPAIVRIWLCTHDQLPVSRDQSAGGVAAAELEVVADDNAASWRTAVLPREQGPEGDAVDGEHTDSAVVSRVHARELAKCAVPVTDVSHVRNVGASYCWR